MLDKINAFFNTQVAPHREKVEGANEQHLIIATGALLLEMAYADSDFSELEEKKILTILQKEYQLSSEDSARLLDLSREEREESLDLWQFTNLINQNFNNEEKIRVLEILWHVIFADGKVDKYEDQLIRKVSFLLDLHHRDMIDTKIRVKENLGLL